MNPYVVDGSCQSPHKLLLTFGNNEQRVSDLTSYLHYCVFQPLQNEDFYQQLIARLNTVTWNNTIDFDLDTLFLESY